MSVAAGLHEIFPREQVGGPTGALYEYQYHQAAAALPMMKTGESPK